MFFRRMGISWRLALGFAVLILLLAVVAGTSLVRLSEFKQFTAVRVPKLIAAQDLEAALFQAARQMRDVVILDNEKEIKEALVAVEKGRPRRKDVLGQLEKLLSPGKEQELFRAITVVQAQYEPHEDEFLKTTRRGDYSSAKDVMLDRVRPAQAKYIDAINQFAKYEVEQSTGEAKAADETYKSTVVLISVLGLIAVVCGVVAAWLIIRGLVRQLREAVGVLEAVAAGDFTRKLQVDTADEVGRMAEALNRAVDGMRTALHEVGLAANQAASASQQLSAASTQLSSGAQEQASSLEETAASLEEITGTVRQNADNARQANQLAVGSRDVAEKGGQVVAEAVRSMTEINQASKKIADIITTIDEIAFQTNLLALNAAVEAARAGEQGRGFAVVASEVRNLAQRSATAAKEIKGLIQDSVQKVEAGSALVNRSGETLQEIVTSVKRVTDIIAEIAEASREQARGIDQVNKAVTQMDEVTQANAAQTEELSSTAQLLAAQAEELQTLVGRFKLGASHSSPVEEAPGRAPEPRPQPAPVARAAGLERRATHVKRLRGRKTDEPALAAVPVGNGGTEHKDHSFEEF